MFAKEWTLWYNEAKKKICGGGREEEAEEEERGRDGFVSEEVRGGRPPNERYLLVVRDGM